MTGNGDDRRPSTLLGPLAVLVLLGLGAVFVLGTARAPKEPVAELTTDAPLPELAPRAASSLTPVLDAAADGVPFKPHDPRVPDPEGPMHPHPITPEHERIFRENNLFAAISGAMDRRDTKGMRELLAEYKAGYPEDAHLLQAGFAIIADCIDHPGEASTEAARAYYHAHKASNLRRYVRRHCFDGGAVR